MLKAHWRLSNLLLLSLLVIVNINCRVIPPATSPQKPLLGAPKSCAKTCSGNNDIVKFVPKTAYEYQFEFTTESTAPYDKESKVNYVVKGKATVEVVSTCDMALHLTEISVKDSWKASQGLGHELRESEKLQKELQGKVMKFAYDNGRITQICPHFQDSTYSVNLKTAILSHLQVSVDQLESTSYVRENDITGDCLTTYSPTDEPPKFVRLEKSKSISGCGKKYKVFDAGVSRIQTNPATSKKLAAIDGTHKCNIKLQRESVPLKITCEEVTILGDIDDKDTEGRFKMISKTMVEKVSEKGIEKARQMASYSMRPLDPVFLHNDKIRPVEYTEEEAVKTLTSLSTASASERSYYFSELVDQMKGINTFDALTSKAKAMGPESYTIFMDALAATKTEASILYLLKPEVLKEAGPNYMISLYGLEFVSSDMIKATSGLMDSSLKKEKLLTIGSIIKRYCDIMPNCMDNEDVAAIAKKLQNMLPADCTSGDLGENTMVFKAIGNMGNSPDPKSLIEKLSMCMLQTKDSQMAIYAADAFRRFGCNQIIDDGLYNVFTNMIVYVPIRVTAYRAYTNCLTDAKVKKVLNFTLHTEMSDQFGGYVYSHLMSVASTNTENNWNSKFLLEQYMPALKEMDEKFSKSSFLSSKHFRKNLGIDSLSANFEADIVLGYSSPLPALGRFNLTLNSFGLETSFLEVGYDSEKLPKLEEMFNMKREQKYKGQIDNPYLKYDKKMQDFYARPNRTGVYIRVFNDEWMANHDVKMEAALTNAENCLKYLEDRQMNLIDRTIAIPTISGVAVELTRQISFSSGVKVGQEKLHIKGGLTRKEKFLIDTGVHKLGLVYRKSVGVELPLEVSTSDSGVIIKPFKEAVQVFFSRSNISAIHDKQKASINVVSASTEITPGGLLKRFGIDAKITMDNYKPPRLYNFNQGSFGVLVNKFDGFKFAYKKGDNLYDISLSTVNKPEDGSDPEIVQVAYNMDFDKEIFFLVHLPTDDKYKVALKYDQVSGAINGELILATWKAIVDGKFSFDKATSKRTFDLKLKSSDDQTAECKASSDFKNELILDMKRTSPGPDRSYKLHALRKDGVKNPRYAYSTKYYVMTQLVWGDFKMSELVDLTWSSGDGTQIKGSGSHSYNYQANSGSYKFDVNFENGARFNNEKEKISGNGLLLTVTSTKKASDPQSADLSMEMKASLFTATKQVGYEAEVYYKPANSASNIFEVNFRHFRNKNVEKSITKWDSETLGKLKVQRYALDGSFDCKTKMEFLNMLNYAPILGKLNCQFVLIPKQKFINVDMDHNVEGGVYNTIVDVNLNGVNNYKVNNKFLVDGLESTIILSGSNIKNYKVISKFSTFSLESLALSSDVFEDEKKIYTAVCKLSQNGSFTSQCDNEIEAQITFNDVRQSKPVLVYQGQHKFSFSNFPKSDNLACVGYELTSKNLVPKYSINSEVKSIIDFRMNDGVLKKFKFKQRYQIGDEEDKENKKKYGLQLKYVPYQLDGRVYLGMKDPYELALGADMTEKQEFEGTLSLGVPNYLKIKYEQNVKLELGMFTTKHKLAADLAKLVPHWRPIYSKATTKIYYKEKYGFETVGEGSLFSSEEANEEFKVSSFVHLKPAELTVKWESQAIGRLVNYEVFDLMCRVDSITSTSMNGKLMVTLREFGGRGVSFVEALLTSTFTGLSDFKSVLDIKANFKKDITGKVTYEHSVKPDFTDFKANALVLWENQEYMRLSSDYQLKQQNCIFNVNFKLPVRQIEVVYKNTLNLLSSETRKFKSDSKLGWTIRDRKGFLNWIVDGQMLTAIENWVYRADFTWTSDVPLLGDGQIGAHFTMKDNKYEIGSKLIYKTAKFVDMLCMADGIEKKLTMKFESEKLLGSSKLEGQFSAIEQGFRMNGDFSFNNAQDKVELKKLELGINDFNMEILFNIKGLDWKNLKVQEKWKLDIENFSYEANSEYIWNDKKFGEVEWKMSLMFPMVIRSEFEFSPTRTFKFNYQSRVPFAESRVDNLDAELHIEALPYFGKMGTVCQLKTGESVTILNKFYSQHDLLKLIYFDFMWKNKDGSYELNSNAEMDAFGQKFKRLPIKLMGKTDGPSASGKLNVADYGDFTFVLTKKAEEIALDLKSASGSPFKNLQILFKREPKTQLSLLIKIDDITEIRMSIKGSIKEVNVFEMSEESYLKLNSKELWKSSSNVALNKMQSLKYKWTLELPSLASKQDMDFSFESVKEKGNLQASLVSQPAFNFGPLKAISKVNLVADMNVLMNKLTSVLRLNEVKLFTLDTEFSMKSSKDFQYFILTTHRTSLDSIEESTSAIVKVNLNAESEISLKAFGLNSGLKHKKSTMESSAWLNLPSRDINHELNTNLLKLIHAIVSAKKPIWSAMPEGEEFFFEYNVDNRATLTYNLNDGQRVYTFTMQPTQLMMALTVSGKTPLKVDTTFDWDCGTCGVQKMRGEVGYEWKSDETVITIGAHVGQFIPYNKLVFHRFGMNKVTVNYDSVQYKVYLEGRLDQPILLVIEVKDAMANDRTLWKATLKVLRTDLDLVYESSEKTVALIINPSKHNFEFWWNKITDSGITINCAPVDQKRQLTLTTPLRNVKFERIVKSSINNKELKITVTDPSGNDIKKNMDAIIVLRSQPNKLTMEISSSFLNVDKSCSVLEQYKDDMSYYGRASIKLTSCDSEVDSVASLSYLGINKRGDDKFEHGFFAKMNDYYYGAKAVIGLNRKAKLYFNSSKLPEESVWDVVYRYPNELKLTNNAGTTLMYKRSTSQGMLLMESLIDVGNKNKFYFETKSEMTLNPPRLNTVIKTVKGEAHINFGAQSSSSYLARIYHINNARKNTMDARFEIGLEANSNIFNVKSFYREKMLSDAVVFGTRIFDPDHLPVIADKAINDIRFAVTQGFGSIGSGIAGKLKSGEIVTYIRDLLNDFDQIVPTIKQWFARDDYFLRSIFGKTTLLEEIQKRFAFKNVYKNIESVSKGDSQESESIRKALAKLLEELKPKVISALDLGLMAKHNKEVIACINQLKMKWNDLLVKLTESAKILAENMKVKGDQISTTISPYASYFSQFYADLYKAIMEIEPLKRIVQLFTEMFDFESIKNSMKQYLSNYLNFDDEEKSEAKKVREALLSGEVKTAYDLYFKPEKFSIQFSQAGGNVDVKLQSYMPRIARIAWKVTSEMTAKSLMQVYIRNYMSYIEKFNSFQILFMPTNIDIVKGRVAHIYLGSGDVRTFDGVFKRLPLSNTYSVLLIRDFVTGLLGMKANVDNNDLTIEVQLADLQVKIDKQMNVLVGNKEITYPYTESTNTASLVVTRNGVQTVVTLALERGYTVKLILNSDLKLISFRACKYTFGQLSGFLGSNNLANIDDMLDMDKIGFCQGTTRACASVWLLSGSIGYSTKKNQSDCPLTPDCKAISLSECDEIIPRKPYTETCISACSDPQTFQSIYNEACEAAGVNTPKASVMPLKSSKQTTDKAVLLLVELSASMKTRYDEIEDAITALETRYGPKEIYTAVVFGGPMKNQASSVSKEEKITFTPVELKALLKEKLDRVPKETGDVSPMQALELARSLSQLKPSTILLFASSKCIDNANVGFQVKRWLQDGNISFHHLMVDGITPADSKVLGVDANRNVYVNQEGKVAQSTTGSANDLALDDCSTFVYNNGSRWNYKKYAKERSLVRKIMSQIVALSHNG